MSSKETFSCFDFQLKESLDVFKYQVGYQRKVLFEIPKAEILPYAEGLARMFGSDEEPEMMAWVITALQQKDTVVKSEVFENTSINISVEADKRVFAQIDWNTEESNNSFISVLKETGLTALAEDAKINNRHYPEVTVKGYGTITLDRDHSLKITYPEKIDTDYYPSLKGTDGNVLFETEYFGSSEGEIMRSVKCDAIGNPSYLDMDDIGANMTIERDVKHKGAEIYYGGQPLEIESSRKSKSNVELSM